MKLLDYIDTFNLETPFRNYCTKTGMDDNVLSWILQPWSVRINTHSKTQFGCVDFSTHVMELTSEFYQGAEGDLHPERVWWHNDTLLHECAHIIVGAMCPDERINHGPVWQQIAVTLGAEPTASKRAQFMCDAMEKQRAQYKHVYTCACCGSAGRYRRQLKGARMCGKCHSIDIIYRKEG